MNSQITPPPTYALFYGSLRAKPEGAKQFYNFGRFGKGTQVYINTLTLEGYELYDLGPYPAVCEGEGSIVVELHRVDSLAFSLIGRMEKGAGYFEKKVKVDDAEASIYLMLKEDLIYGGAKRIITGDWADKH